jgi:hypothetical protein
MPITDSRWSGATPKVIETETGADGLVVGDAGVYGELIDVGGAVYNARHPSFAGGAKADPAVDDAGALNALVAAVPRGGHVVVPPGTYRLGSELRLEKAMTFDASRARFVVEHAGHGIVVSPPAGTLSIGGDTVEERMIVNIGSIERSSGTLLTQDATSAGLRCVNMYYARVRVGSIVGFRRGIWLHATKTGATAKGCVTNDVQVAQNRNHVGWYLSADTRGWVTANELSALHIHGHTGTNGAAADITGVIYDNYINPDVNITETNGNGVSSNTFRNLVVEGWNRVGVKFLGGAARNQHRSCYFEMNFEEPVFATLAIDNRGGGIQNLFVDKRGLIDALANGRVNDGNFADTNNDGVEEHAFNRLLTIVGSRIQWGSVEHYNGQTFTKGDQQGYPKPTKEWHPLDHGGLGQIGAVRTYNGTAQVPLNLQGVRRFTINLSANLPTPVAPTRDANGEITDPGQGVALVNVPSDGCEIDVTLNRSGNTFYTVDPGWLEGIRYAHHPRPLVPGSTSMTYRLHVTPGATAAAPPLVEVVSVRHTGLRTVSLDSIAAAPAYVGQTAVVAGVAYRAAGTSAADWIFDGWRKGTTAQRPAPVAPATTLADGLPFYDTSVRKLIFWDASATVWRDALGTTV